LADLLARKGHDVRLWAHEPEVAQAITVDHENTAFLTGVALTPSLRASHDLSAVVRTAAVICSVVPSHVSREIWTAIAPQVAAGTRLVCATKGIENDSLLLMGDVAKESLPQAVFVAL